MLGGFAETSISVTAFAHLATEIHQVLFREAAFQKRPGVHAGGGVALKVHLVATEAVVAATPAPVRAAP